MKISCTQENLNQGLFIVSHLASKNTTLPILNNILFQVKDNTIKLSATNLEMGINCNIRGKVEREGEFTVQSKLLADYAALLPKEKVDLEAPENTDTDQVISVSCKNYETKIKGQAANDFPVIPQVEKNNPYVIDYENFRKAISQVVFAVSVSETRPEINGVLFDVSENYLTMVATDSYRLAEKKVPLNSRSNKDDKKVIIPSKTLQEIQRILGSLKDPAAISEIESIEFYITDNQVLFVLGNIELVSRLVEGQYPDYQQIIPQEVKTKVKLDVSEITKAVKTAGLFTRAGIHDVKLEVIGGEVIISSTNNQLGENVSKILVTPEGDDNNIILNYRYLLDGLQNIATSEVEIDIIDNNNPCVLKPSGDTNDYMYIIMPIKQ